MNEYVLVEVFTLLTDVENHDSVYHHRDAVSVVTRRSLLIFC